MKINIGIFSVQFSFRITDIFKEIFFLCYTLYLLLNLYNKNIEYKIKRMYIFKMIFFSFKSIYNPSGSSSMPHQLSAQRGFNIITTVQCRIKHI